MFIKKTVGISINHMNRKIILFVLFFLITYFIPQKVDASEKAKSVSAEFITASEEPLPVHHIDNRGDVLKRFLERYDSPLADESQTFVLEADKNHIDWKLLPAISGVESTFGQAVPPDCPNAWGYNIYDGHTRCFTDFKEAIQVISYDIRHVYMDQWGATDVYSLGHLYAASPTWPQRVAMYMQQIDDFDNKVSSPTLPISL